MPIPMCRALRRQERLLTTFHPKRTPDRRRHPVDLAGIEDEPEQETLFGNAGTFTVATRMRPCWPPTLLDGKTLSVAALGAA